MSLELGKLLVPTPPIRDPGGNIISGKDDDRSVVSGIFGSFSDAPGGFKEELKEINVSSGLECTFQRQLALRAGYCYQDPGKGNRRYFTIGAGFAFSSLSLNMAYTAAGQDKNPAAGSLRFSAAYAFDHEKKK